MLPSSTFHAPCINFPHSRCRLLREPYLRSRGVAATGLPPACFNFSIRASSRSPRFTNLACHSFLYGRKLETRVRATSKLRYHLRLAGTIYQGASSVLHLESASP